MFFSATTRAVHFSFVRVYGIRLGYHGHGKQLVRVPVWFRSQTVKILLAASLQTSYQSTVFCGQMIHLTAKATPEALNNEVPSEKHDGTTFNLLHLTW